jgi:hypothetical protein
MTMERPGVMAPPDLYERAARPALMSAATPAAHLEVSLRTFLWSIATVLAAVELLVELSS